MRTIKFGGKRLDNGEWAEGSLLTDETDVKSIVYAVEACDAEIIGNIHDNPELIESNAE